MDGVSLLERARRVGLDVRTDGHRLLVKGPKRLCDLAQALLAAKAEVLAELQSEARLAAAVRGEVPICAEDFGIRTVDDLLGAWETGEPPRECRACSTSRWWRLTGPPSKASPWICGTCHAPSVPADRVEWFKGKRP